jgi:hypothetical protein
VKIFLLHSRVAFSADIKYLWGLHFVAFRGDSEHFWGLRFVVFRSNSEHPYGLQFENLSELPCSSFRQ